MQDQLTGGQSSLQQPRSDLQQNTSNLQQSGTPTTAGNTASVLSESAPQGQLKVSTATTPTPSSVTPSTVEPGGNTALLWLLIIPVVLIIAILASPRTKGQEVVELVDDPVLPEPAAPPAKRTKKKSSKRKKSGRR